MRDTPRLAELLSATHITPLNVAMVIAREATSFAMIILLQGPPDHIYTLEHHLKSTR